MGTLKKASAFAHHLTQILLLKERVRLSPSSFRARSYGVACHEGAEPLPDKLLYIYKARVPGISDFAAAYPLDVALHTTSSTNYIRKKPHLLICNYKLEYVRICKKSADMGTYRLIKSI